MSSSTDLIVPGDDSPYAVLTMDNEEVTGLIRDSLAPGQQLGLGDLPRIKTPAGGAISWEIPDPLEGERSERELRGVLIHVATRRAFWKEKYEGQNDPPNCASQDALHGEGDPGGDCLRCPLNEFGTSEFSENAKACKEIRQLFLIPPEGILPYVINVQPGSLKNANTFFTGLLNARLKRTDIESILTLQKAKNKGGVEFSQIVFRKGDDLAPESKERMAAYAVTLKPYLERVEVVHGDVSTEEGPVGARDGDPADADPVEATS